MNRHIIRASFSRGWQRLLIVSQELPTKQGGDGSYTVWSLHASMNEPPRPLVSYSVPYGSYQESNKVRAKASMMARTLASVDDQEFERVVASLVPSTPIQTAP